MFFSMILVMVVAIVSVFFALENTEVVQVTFFKYPLNGSIGVILLVTFGVGILMGIVLMMPAMISRSIKIARHRRRIGELEQQPPDDYGN
jgi:uncharacterized integral membrane protein